MVQTYQPGDEVYDIVRKCVWEVVEDDGGDFVELCAPPCTREAQWPKDRFGVIRTSLCPFRAISKYEYLMDGKWLPVPGDGEADDS